MSTNRDPGLELDDQQALAAVNWHLEVFTGANEPMEIEGEQRRPIFSLDKPKAKEVKAYGLLRRTPKLIGTFTVEAFRHAGYSSELQPLAIVGRDGNHFGLSAADSLPIFFEAVVFTDLTDKLHEVVQALRGQQHIADSRRLET
ncbi:MAG TPA: hypothetical protein VIJ68_04185 [Candidatus Saccharimonadales bacterium]